MLIHKPLEKSRCAKLYANWTTNQNYSTLLPAELTCPPDFDRTFCWNESRPGSYRLECPFEFCTDCGVQERFAIRTCTENGSWLQTDYEACRFIYRNQSQCINQRCSPCADSFWEFIRNLTLSLSVISVVLLILCLFIFSAYRSLQCARNTMHKHLSIAFIIRFAIFILWLLMNRFRVFDGCAGLDRANIQWLCKTILVLLSYSTLASMHWMFVEGVYLAAKVSVFAMSGDGPMPLYWGVGWGLPLIWVLIWALLMQLEDKEKYCWLPYTNSPFKWVLLGPMFIVLAINVLLLIIIVIIIIRKVSADNVQEHRKLWKTVKATLLLVPLLGVANLLFLNEPSSQNLIVFRIYIILQAIMEHSQGITIAVLYCFLNGDVRHEISRTLKQRMSQRRRSSMPYQSVKARESLAPTTASENAICKSALLIRKKTDENGTYVSVVEALPQADAAKLSENNDEGIGDYSPEPQRTTTLRTSVVDHSGHPREVRAEYIEIAQNEDCVPIYI